VGCGSRAEAQALLLLEKLGIERCGFHAFRHGNETVMDGEVAQWRLDRIASVTPTRARPNMLTALIESRVHLCEFLGSSLTGLFGNFLPWSSAERSLAFGDLRLSIRMVAGYRELAEMEDFRGCEGLQCSQAATACHFATDWL
jgi:hypothetical protein